MMRFTLIASFVLSTLGFSITQAASFDCTRAAAPVEKAICSDPRIDALDERLGEAYRAAREAVTREEAEVLKQRQRNWLATRNRTCRPDFAADCLAGFYERRIAALELLTSPRYPAYASADAAGDYDRGQAMSMRVEALGPRKVTVEIDGAEPTMARWICEFAGSGEIDDEGLARIAPTSGHAPIYIAFDGGVATVDDETDSSPWCGRGGTLNGHYVRTASALSLPPAPTDYDAAEPDYLADTWDYQTPLPLVRLRAQRGDADAQNELAGHYASGHEIARDMDEALSWYAKAAAQGSVDAMYNLGFTHYYGQGVKKNAEEGLKWFRKASELGFGPATLEIAQILESGAETAQDRENALKWYIEAAEQGDPWAQYTLGSRYYAGQGVARDHNEAARWFLRAAEQNEAESQYRLALMYMNGEGIPQDYVQSYKWCLIATAQTEGPGDDEGLMVQLEQSMSPADIARARRLADDWRTTYRRAH